MAIAEEDNEVLPSIIEEFLKEQKTYAYCKEAPLTVRHTTFLFDIDRDCVLMCHAPLSELSKR